MNLDETAARIALQLLPIEDLPEIARQALCQGLDSHALRMLAASGPDEFPQELQRLFTRATQELGVAIPDKVSAARALLLLYLRDIAQAKVPPAQGVRQILHDLQFAVGYDLDKSHVGEGLGIGTLLSVYDSYDNAACGAVLEEATHVIDQKIVEEAKRLLAGVEPGTAPNGAPETAVGGRESHRGR